MKRKDPGRSRRKKDGILGIYYSILTFLYFSSLWMNKKYSKRSKRESKRPLLAEFVLFWSNIKLYVTLGFLLCPLIFPLIVHIFKSTWSILRFYNYLGTISWLILKAYELISKTLTWTITQQKICFFIEFIVFDQLLYVDYATSNYLLVLLLRISLASMFMIDIFEHLLDEPPNNKIIQLSVTSIPLTKSIEDCPKDKKRFIVYMNGKPLPIELYESDLVKNIKSIIHSKSDYPIENQRLFIGTKLMEDEMPISAYNIDKDQGIYLHIPTFGGGANRSKPVKTLPFLKNITSSNISNSQFIEHFSTCQICRLINNNCNDVQLMMQELNAAQFTQLLMNDSLPENIRDTLETYVSEHKENWTFKYPPKYQNSTSKYSNEIMKQQIIKHFKNCVKCKAGVCGELLTTLTNITIEVIEYILRDKQLKSGLKHIMITKYRERTGKRVPGNFIIDSFPSSSKTKGQQCHESCPSNQQYPIISEPSSSSAPPKYRNPFLPQSNIYIPETFLNAQQNQLFETDICKNFEDLKLDEDEFTSAQKDLEQIRRFTLDNAYGQCPICKMYFPFTSTEASESRHFMICKNEHILKLEKIIKSKTDQETLNSTSLIQNCQKHVPHPKSEPFSATPSDHISSKNSKINYDEIIQSESELSSESDTDNTCDFQDSSESEAEDTPSNIFQIKRESNKSKNDDSPPTKKLKHQLELINDTDKNDFHIVPPAISQDQWKNQGNAVAENFTMRQAIALYRTYLFITNSNQFGLSFIECKSETEINKFLHSNEENPDYVFITIRQNTSWSEFGLWVKNGKVFYSINPERKPKTESQLEDVATQFKGHGIVINKIMNFPYDNIQIIETDSNNGQFYIFALMMLLTCFTKFDKIDIIDLNKIKQFVKGTVRSIQKHGQDKNWESNVQKLGEFCNSSGEILNRRSHGATPSLSYINNVPSQKAANTSSPPTSTNGDMNKEIETTTTSSTVPHPVGLPNLGNTCFFNACIQTLFTIPEFVQTIQTSDIKHSPNSIASEMKQLLQKYETGDQNMTEICRKILTKLGRHGSTQEDMPEFFYKILQSLSTNESEQVHNYTEKFHTGEKLQTVKCQNCPNINHAAEPFSHILLPLNTTVSLHQAIINEVTRDEIIDNYTCERCGKKESAQALKHDTITQLPKILVLQLKRFDSNLTKINHAVTFPDYINLLPILNSCHENPPEAESLKCDSNDKWLNCSPNDAKIQSMLSDNKEIFQLVAVTHHHGGKMEGGHYTTGVYRHDTWHTCNDENISQTEALSIAEFTEQCYMLVYRKIDKEDPPATSTNNIFDRHMNVDNNLENNSTISKPQSQKLKDPQDSSTLNKIAVKQNKIPVITLPGAETDLYERQRKPTRRQLIFSDNSDDDKDDIATPAKPSQKPLPGSTSKRSTRNSNTSNPDKDNDDPTEVTSSSPITTNQHEFIYNEGTEGDDFYTSFSTYLTENGIPTSPDNLRQKAAKYIQDNDILYHDFIDLEIYLGENGRQRTYITQEEIIALANIYSVTVHVHSSTGTTVTTTHKLHKNDATFLEKFRAVKNVRANKHHSRNSVLLNFPDPVTDKVGKANLQSLIQSPTYAYEDTGYTSKRFSIVPDYEVLPSIELVGSFRGLSRELLHQLIYQDYSGKQIAALSPKAKEELLFKRHQLLVFYARIGLLPNTSQCSTKGCNKQMVLIQKATLSPGYHWRCKTQNVICSILRVHNNEFMFSRPIPFNIPLQLIFHFSKGETAEQIAKKLETNAYEYFIGPGEGSLTALLDKGIAGSPYKSIEQFFADETLDHMGLIMYWIRITAGNKDNDYHTEVNSSSWITATEQEFRGDDFYTSVSTYLAELGIHITPDHLRQEAEKYIQDNNTLYHDFIELQNDLASNGQKRGSIAREEIIALANICNLTIHVHSTTGTKVTTTSKACNTLPTVLHLAHNGRNLYEYFAFHSDDNGEDDDVDAPTETTRKERSDAFREHLKNFDLGNNCPEVEKFITELEVSGIYVYQLCYIDENGGARVIWSGVSNDPNKRWREHVRNNDKNEAKRAIFEKYGDQMFMRILFKGTLAQCLMLEHLLIHNAHEFGDELVNKDMKTKKLEFQSNVMDALRELIANAEQMNVRRTKRMTFGDSLSTFTIDEAECPKLMKLLDEIIEPDCFVYCLKYSTTDGTAIIMFYIGVSDDPERRAIEHRSATTGNTDKWKIIRDNKSRVFMKIFLKNTRAVCEIVEQLLIQDEEEKNLTNKAKRCAENPEVEADLNLVVAELKSLEESNNVRLPIKEAIYPEKYREPPIIRSARTNLQIRTIRRSTNLLNSTNDVQLNFPEPVTKEVANANLNLVFQSPKYGYNVTGKRRSRFSIVPDDEVLPSTELVGSFSSPTHELLHNLIDYPHYRGTDLSPASKEELQINRHQLLVFYARIGLLSNTMSCPSCNKPMVLVQSINTSAGYRWQCYEGKIHCDASQVNNNKFMFPYQIPFNIPLQLIFHFSKGETAEQIAKKLETNAYEYFIGPGEGSLTALLDKGIAGSPYKSIEQFFADETLDHMGLIIYWIHTAGTSFRYIFTRNAHFNLYPYLKFYFVNQDKSETAVITFLYNSIKSNQSVSWNVSVPSLQFGFYQLKASDLIWQFISDGIQRQPNSVIFITSTAPIRLYAANFDISTNQADTVTILPDTMANSNYIITLPSAAPRRIYDSLQYQILHFLPVNFNIPTTVTIKVAYSINKTVTLDLTADDPKYVYYIAQSGTVSHLPRTYYIQASQPILIAAAVTCTPVLSKFGSSTGCDFAAFMPPPVFMQDCESPGYDISGSNTFNTRTFFVSPPIWNCAHEKQISKLSYFQSDGVINVKNISSNSYQPSIKVLPQEAVAFQSDNAMILINRLGGVDLPDTAEHSGAYLTHVPSGSQMLTGIQYFFILSETAYIEVISSTPDVIVDNFTLAPLTTLPNPFGDWYFFKHSVNNTQIIHFIYTVGNFAATVIGYHPDGGLTSYGYQIAYNKPQYGGKYSTEAPRVLTTVASLKDGII